MKHILSFSYQSTIFSLLLYTVDDDMVYGFLLKNVFLSHTNESELQEIERISGMCSLVSYCHTLL